jgi:hypothetical protein
MIIEVAELDRIHVTIDDGNRRFQRRRRALIYEQGQSEILPARARCSASLSAISPSEAPARRGYGPVDDSLFETVPASVVPENGRQVGSYLVAQAKTGERAKCGFTK